MTLRTLTQIEARYVVVERLIGQANDKMRDLSRVLSRGGNLDLFIPDQEVTVWRGIRAVLIDESDRLEKLWQGRAHASTH